MEPSEDTGAAVEKERDIFGKVPKDRADWSHRKGEPRVFALLWTAFLMAATLLMFASLSAAWVVSPEAYRPAARSLLMVVSVGVVVLWPMTRLCQAPPRERAVWATFKDMVVVIAPVQALVWPHALRMLAGWPVEVVAGLSCSMIAWGVVAGGVLALAQVSAPSGAWAGLALRWVWMLVFVGMVVGAPLAMGVLGLLRVDGIDGASPGTTMGWMFSAPTSVAELTRARVWTGRPASIGGMHWAAIVWTLCVGAGCWAGAWAVGLARRGRSA